MLAGLFSFALHLMRVQGFYFCPAAYQPRASVYSVFHAVNAVYTAHAAKQRTGLHSGFSCNLPCFYACYLAVHPAMLYSLQGAGGHTDKCSTSSTYQIPPPRRTPCRSAQPPYYNKVYKGSGAPLLWIHARRCSISQTMPARRGQLLPWADRWQVLHPAHLLRGSASQPVQGQPGSVSMLPTPG